MMTFFEIFDVPVYWPILLLYFISLFLVTMKRQIRHMIRHRYAQAGAWGWMRLGKRASEGRMLLRQLPIGIIRDRGRPGLDWLARD